MSWAPPSPTSTSSLYPPGAAAASSSSFRRQLSMDTTSPLKPELEEDDDLFDPFALDPTYRLRTVKTAHSVLAESIHADRDREKHQRRRTLFRSLTRKRNRKRADSDVTAVTAVTTTTTTVTPEPAGARRKVYINTPLPPDLLTKSGDPLIRYVRNKVRTSKYTILTFIPKNLFEQFRRVANIFFLICVILQSISIFGASMPQIGMLPLITILGMTAIKDGIEDWRRAQLDMEVNNSATTKLGGWRNVNQPEDPRTWLEKMFKKDGPSKGVRKLREREAAVDGIKMESLDSSDYKDLPSTAQWERTLWKKLEVGDLVFLQEDDQIPADIIVLSTSNPDGLAFVETKNLDGETNLKIRKSLKATIDLRRELEHAQFVLDSEPPHANLYTYNGVLHWNNHKEAITINEMLLRGCTLRNTKWVIGVVLFTGADTKIMLNGGETPSKRSKIEKETNFNVIMNFCLLTILCVTTGIFHGWYQSLSGTSANYYEIGAAVSSNIYLDSLVIVASCLILFQNIVPISLYITIEIVKTIQAFFIFQDVEMYYDAYDTPCVPKTWNISDDLGQIEYVFSDKTGTLTQNIMEFKKFSVAGVSFGEGMTEAMMGAAKREGREVLDQEEELAMMKRAMVSAMRAGASEVAPEGAMESTQESAQNPASKLAEARSTGSARAPYLREDKLTLISPMLPRCLTDRTDPIRPHLHAFWRAIAICHTVLADVQKPYMIDYKAESPDEAALVAAARDVGFTFLARSNSRIDIDVLGTVEHWTPLKVLEFNSTRKRMSVVVRDPSGRIVLFCKGADSVIYERLARDQSPLREQTLGHLEAFANGGLRTLCVAHRYLSEEEYSEWSKRYDDACAAIVDRDGEIDKACELVEHSLIILGATALEDKLQEGVPEAIATLHKAGIKLWILTGDKLQTAIEIGYSCNLLTNDMEVMIVSATSEAGARAQIEAGLRKMATPGTFAVVIDGESLRYALEDSLRSLFLSLGTQCAAVICCRVSPAQKAQTVKMVKDGCNAMTLSIGDGANDVAMIQEANVGVGLFGLEGSQAAMSADYAFGQFRFLTRLLLVHGRWSYVRVADMHANFFYKNTIWTVSMFWFLIFNSFDGTYLYEYTFVLLFNLVFTSLPVGILGAFDQDTNARASLAFPQLYQRGIRGLDYTRTRFWLYMGDGLYQSAILFFIPYLAYGTGVPWSHQGMDTNGLYDFGTACAAAGVSAANIYVGINMRYWTWITAAVIICSTLAVYLWIPIYSVLGSWPYNGTAQVVFTTFSFWAIILITLFIAVGPRWLVKAVKTSYMPLDRDIVREAWIAGDLKDTLGVGHRRRRTPPPGYHPANMSSPQKEPYNSPLVSGPTTPVSPTPPGPRPPSPLNPATPIILTSPKFQAFTLASGEIRRMDEDSRQLKRASLGVPRAETLVDGSTMDFSQGSGWRSPRGSRASYLSTGSAGWAQ
ncbi:hypothetical protein BD324DRAFT_639819 [Kockovaella imperatae]|uniref:Phospholipid-transporting ATPase n=1 Tax=Kockovaella imperatae TaxID=4999 RepID=A0A1Y1U5Z1_9TREE|nr:hypothetical protein BD324DRAFT_639819 [Kockovaella imperatae]ORX33448.1 hypothetical protein BD324DRAFT_639819 [Kockovaella imperatae]